MKFVAIIIIALAFTTTAYVQGDGAQQKNRKHVRR